MAHDYRTERVEPAWRIQEHAHPHEGQRRHLPPHAYEAPPRPPPHPSAEDVASVLGMPADSVTPAVLAAAVPLLAEIERLHWRAEQAEHRLAWLERLSDTHPLVPCLSRRALVRELEAFLAGADALGTLAVLQVTGVEALRQHQGLAAGEAAMRHVCANLLSVMRTSDLVGCLGGSDFAVVLVGAEPDQARDKMEEACGRIRVPAFTWAEQPAALIPAFGLYRLQSGEGADQALAAADRARRGLD